MPVGPTLPVGPVDPTGPVIPGGPSIGVISIIEVTSEIHKNCVKNEHVFAAL